MSAADAERACLAAAQPPEEHASDLAALVALDVARIVEAAGLPGRARDVLAARAPHHWRAVALLLATVDGPLAAAALDAVMMLGRGRLVAAADALAIARGQTLRGWCKTMRGVRL